MQELDELDKQEAANGNDELQIKKEKITQGLAKLKERTIKYDALQQQLDNTTDKQISTNDPESRSIIIVKNIVEVAYNTQNVVDDKHNLIVHTQAPTAMMARLYTKQPSRPNKIYKYKKKIVSWCWPIKAIIPAQSYCNVRMII